MSLMVQRGPAVLAIVAFGLATWGGGQGVSPVAAQGTAERPSKLDVDLAVGSDAAQSFTAKLRPGRSAFPAKPDTAAAERAVLEPDVKPAVDRQAGPHAPRATDSAGYAGPRLVHGEHRLQAPFPDHNVVVCLAGCPSGKETIVFFEKRPTISRTSYGTLSSARVMSVGMASDVQSTASTTRPSPAPVENAGGITCLAGCYSTPKTYTGRRGLEIQQPQHGRVTDGTWMTVTSASEPPADAVSAEVSVTRRGRQKTIRRNDSLGSEWFTRRF